LEALMSTVPNLTGQGDKYSARQARLVAGLKAAGLDGIVLNPGPTLAYLTGLQFHLMERPVAAIFTPDQPPVLVLPELEQAKLTALAFPIRPVYYGEDPSAWPDAFQAAVRLAEIETGRVGVEPVRLRFLELEYLQSAAPETRFSAAGQFLAGLRMRKDADEVAAMRNAVAIAQNALLATLPSIRSGMTERELAAELTLQLLRAGAESELPFAPIVSSGPNSANPHAVPSERRLTPGDLLVIDWGATYRGYISDLTRTFSVGEPEPELARIAKIVAAANAAGRAAVHPGITAGEVDRATRAVIEAEGYGPEFFHRTGHGVGMEAHEEPYIRAGSSLELEPGMAFTIEPGIYLTGRNGVRIEDNVVVTENGSDCLSDLPRELRIVGA
jgi:Xaa-Pro dipeptidase